MHSTTGRWKLGLVLSLVAALMWGLLPIALKLLLAAMDPYTATWYRFAGAGMALGLILLLRRRLPDLRRLSGGRWKLLTIAVLGLGGNYTLYVAGLQYTTPGAAQVVIQLAPMFLLLGSLAVFRETFRPSQWAGFLVLVVGLLLFFHDRLAELVAGTTEEALGVGMIVVSAALWAAYALAQKQLLKDYSSPSIMLMVYLLAIPLILPLSSPDQVNDLSSFQWFLLVFCCANTLIAYGAFAEALSHWEASRVSAVVTIAPLITLLAMAGFRAIAPHAAPPESLDLPSVTGALLVVIGSFATATAPRLARPARSGA